MFTVACPKAVFLEQSVHMLGIQPSVVSLLPEFWLSTSPLLRVVTTLGTAVKASLTHSSLWSLHSTCRHRAFSHLTLLSQAYASGSKKKRKRDGWDSKKGGKGAAALLWVGFLPCSSAAICMLLATSHCCFQYSSRVTWFRSQLWFMADCVAVQTPCVI